MKEQANPAPLAGDGDQLPKEATRIRAFANFFKNYMSVSTIVTAALPIPATLLEFIPRFEAQKGMLATYSTLFCFLLLAYIFYSRHSLATVFYGRATNMTRTLGATFPFLLILASLAFLIWYHTLLTSSLIDIGTAVGEETAAASDSELLKSTYLTAIPNGTLLIVTYIGFFVAAESAFIFMAIKEYAQDIMKIQDVDMIRKEDIEHYHLQIESLRNAVDYLLWWSIERKKRDAISAITDEPALRQRINALEDEYAELGNNIYMLSSEGYVSQLRERIKVALDMGAEDQVAAIPRGD